MLALSGGSVCRAAHTAATGFFARSASGSASMTWSRATLYWKFGTAISARMAMMATTTISSIRLNPACFIGRKGVEASKQYRKLCADVEMVEGQRRRNVSRPATQRLFHEGVKACLTDTG